MDFWHWGGFFKSVKGHVIKWWQQVILPVFHLNNNEMRNPSNKHEIKRKTDSGMNKAEQGKTYIEEKADIKKQVQEQNNLDSGSDQDALEILKRLEREKQEEEEKTRKEIEDLRRKNQEQERIAAIMNANQVNVNAFIEEGKAIRENTLGEVDTKQQQDMQRAQEIIDRLNREAAEDDAKKRTEIEAARKRVEEVAKQEV